MLGELISKPVDCCRSTPKKELFGEGGIAYAVNGPGPLVWKAGGHVRGICLMKEITNLPGARG
jgi:hypothetical protein